VTFVTVVLKLEHNINNRGIRASGSEFKNSSNITEDFEMKTSDEQAVADDEALWRSLIASIAVVRAGLKQYQEMLENDKAGHSKDYRLDLTIVYAECHLGGLYKDFKNLSIRAGEKRTGPFWLDKDWVDRAILLNKYKHLIPGVYELAHYRDEIITAEMVINKGREQRPNKISLAPNSNGLIQPQRLGASN